MSIYIMSIFLSICIFICFVCYYMYCFCFFFCIFLSSNCMSCNVCVCDIKKPECLPAMNMFKGPVRLASPYFYVDYVYILF